MLDVPSLINNLPPGPIASGMLRASMVEELAEAEREARRLVLANTRLHDAEVAAKEANELAALERGRRDAISRHLNARIKAIHYSRVMLSPIRRIPPEILGEIFMFISDSDWTEVNMSPSPSVFALQHVPGTFMKRPAFVIAAVCKRWREAALSSSRLWRTVRLAVSSGESPEERNLITTLQTSLHRAGLSPLRLAIYAWPLNDLAIHLVSGMLTLLSNHQGQWQRLWLLCNEAGRELTLPILQHPRPMLQSLVLAGCRASLDETLPLPLTVLPSLPNLTEAFIQDFPLPTGLLPRLERLTAISFSRPPAPIFDFLRHCPRLKRLIICGFDWLKTDSADSPIPLPYLTNLTTTSQVGSLFLDKALSFPSLFDLVLVYPSGSLIRSLIDRSDANPTSLHICWPPGLDEARIQQSSLMTLLQSRPALRKLEFDGALPDSVLNALSRPPWPCPRLSTLELHNCGRGDQVMQLIRARRAAHVQQGINPLERVDLMECGSISSSEINDIQMLLQDQTFST